ncbi:COR domain-containing protein [Flavobacterium lacus]|uniref:non-specific serine/threonine protein kinase n=1 Tax=Flavobacterium lacus TaxID=1353778 RepID=A0A328WR37_9FLAO|nr:COR domain-containing protein [Flavobacterium lacus]RAR47556.1 small GTP-binding protein [Flavobacterium lacus]
MNDKKIINQLENLKKHGWTSLDFRNCGLRHIPVEIFENPDIVFMDFGNDKDIDEKFRNKIEYIPDDIGKIKRLAKLNLENNSLKTISDELASLDRLKYLNLRNNKLKQLPEKVANMSQLAVLDIEDNPFDILPPEIASQGIDSIRNFFRELKDPDYLYEVKLILVGEGRVGKTSLSNALIDENFSLEDEKSTEGINIQQWNISNDEVVKYNPEIKRDLLINIWDFGGQEIYHSTHQFFLTKRSLYLLITESRKEDSHEDFFYWLNIIKILGDKSPVLMVLNKCDQPIKDIPIKEYKSNFDNIIDFDKISLVNENCHIDNLKQFRSKVIDIAANLPHIGNPLPKVWVDIRREIEILKSNGKNFIPLDEFEKLCRTYYLTQERTDFLSDFFHDLGVFLHFRNDIVLKQVIFLNHEWITKGVYKILDDSIVKDNKGVFTDHDIDRIWKDSEHKPKTVELISLMKNTKFDLCFEVSSKKYLVPRLLPVDQIEFKWNEKKSTSKFEFRYKFMPKGILARIIVKLNEDIFENIYWRYGVKLKYENTFALIREYYFENKISISLYGDSVKEYLFLIRRAFADIHKDYNELEIKEMVPCICGYCTISSNPHFFHFKVLKKYEISGKARIVCDESLDEVDVNILLSNYGKELGKRKMIVCENLNASLLNTLGFLNIDFLPEKDSFTVFGRVQSDSDIIGFRDKDFILESEKKAIQIDFPNYCILDYYCLENYLFHPENIEELELPDYNKEDYIKNIVLVKNENLLKIASKLNKARSTYFELKYSGEKYRDEKNSEEILDRLKSDKFSEFYEYYSMKDYNKSYLSKFELNQDVLASTNWFRTKVEEMLIKKIKVVKE